VLATVGYLVSARVATTGFTLIALGGLGAIQAIVIGFGLMKIAERRRRNSGR